MSETAAKKDVQKLQRAIVDGLEDVKAQDIRVFNTEHLSPLFERVIVASGTSNRQTKALASSVRDKVREAGFAKPRTEGEENGEWIIVDCGSAVVHVMQPNIRQYYNLEEIWGEKQVKLTGPSSRAKASRSADTTAPARKVAKSAAAPASKEEPAANKVAAKKTVAKKALAAKKAPAAKKAATSQTAARKTASAGVKAPAKKAASRTRAAALPTVVVNKPGKTGAAAKSTARAATKPAVKSATRASAKKAAAPAAKKAVAKAPAKRASR